MKGQMTLLIQSNLQWSPWCVLQDDLLQNYFSENWEELLSITSHLWSQDSITKLTWRQVWFKLLIMNSAYNCLASDEGRHSPGPLCGMKNLLEARQDGVIKIKYGMEACSLQYRDIFIKIILNCCNDNHTLMVIQMFFSKSSANVLDQWFTFYK